MFNNEIDRFGSAAFAEDADIARAGLFHQTDDSLLLGFHGGRPLHYRGQGGLLMEAGARGGKLATVLGYNACAGMARSETFVFLDPKGEIAAISQDQTPDRKSCFYWNPVGLHDLPQDRINPLEALKGDSPTLISDTKMIYENFLASTGSTNGVYFEGRAREIAEAITVTIALTRGSVSLPEVYHTVNLIPTGNEEWLDFAYDMARCGFPLAARVEEEIAASHTHASNAFQSILGELYRGFAALSDPILQASLSPPFTVSFDDICEANQPSQFYLMPPAELIPVWSPIIKGIFVAGLIAKSRRPRAPRQTWVIDECAQLGAFPLVVKLFSYGAGIGLRPWAIYQNNDQMRLTAPNGDTTITASAAVRSYFAIRDIESGTKLSRMLGVQTLAYDDELQQARARHAKHQAIQAMLSGGDPLQSGLEFAYQRREVERQSKMHRLLRTPDEILNTPADRQYIFCDGVEGCIYAERRPYYLERFMAGRFHPNPYHPPTDRVRVKTRFGFEERRVIREPAPAEFESYPQYREGIRSRIAP